MLFILFFFFFFFFFFSSRRRHTRYIGDWSSDVCSSDLISLFCNVLFIISFSPSFKATSLRQPWTVPSAAPVSVQTRDSKERSEERRVGKECKRKWGRES